MISFIVPAHNEEAVLGETLRCINQAAANADRPFELIVVDDASTDRTAEIAREHEAQVVAVALRNIAAVRNAGARAATGDPLIFVDADTLLPNQTLLAVLNEVERGVIGGGALVGFDEPLTWYQHAMCGALAIVWQRILRWAAGCFIYVRREAFQQVGGFDERYFAGEEMFLSRALKARGPFKLVRDRVITSGRKLRMYSARQLVRLAVPLLLGGPKQLRNRDALGILYDDLREG